MDSPFNRSSKTTRSPPPSPAPRTTMEPEETLETVSTPEIQNWMTSIERCLDEVCTIATEGKLNSDQKLRISNLCRKVGHGTSQMAVMYQSLKQKAIQTHASMQTLKENNNISDCLAEFKQTIESCSKPTTGISSFADIVKKGTSTFLQPSPLNSVFIYPNDKLKSSDDTKSLVQKIISPEQIKLQVRGLRKIRNGGVIITTESKQDIEKLKKSVKESTNDLTVDEPPKRRPRIIVIGVPTSLPEYEIFKCIYDQNVAEKMPNMSLDSFLATVKLSHKSGKRDEETCNFILEVPANVRRALISQERAYIKWRSCPVRDFTRVTRCYNCQQYGHAAKTCKDDKPICGHCGELGHSIKECTKKDDAPKCATCMRFKKPNAHKTGDLDCPARKNAEYRYLNSIDYEGA